MRRLLRRTLCCLAPAALAALVLGVPTAAPVDVQPVTIACSVGSPFTLGADPATVTQLALALGAMTDPSCDFTKTDPSAAPDKHFAVGGGLAADGTKFSFSAHANTPDPPSGYAHVSGISPLTVRSTCRGTWSASFAV